MHKYIEGKLPISFKDLFLPLAPPNRTNSFVIKNAKSKFLEQFPTFYLPRVWNNSSLFLKNIEKHKTFKKECQENLIKSYSRHVACRDYMCTDCFPQ